MNVPFFKGSYPSISSLNSEQLKFYRYLVQSINSKKYPPIEGQISYLFIYVYGLLQNWNKSGFESLFDNLLNLAEVYYNEDKIFHWYCQYWAYDCLLGLKQYERYLEFTEPESPKSRIGQSLMRLNVQYLLGRPPQAIDLYKLTNGQVSKISQKHLDIFQNNLDVAFSEYAIKNGDWYNRYFEDEKASPYPYSYHHTLFQSAPIQQPDCGFQTHCFYAAPSWREGIRICSREAENLTRKAIGVPEIGEGWISETELFYALKTAFPETQVIHHGHPPWVGKQHFDVWFPHWRIAVEHQGKQHFVPIEHFGGEEAFKSTIERDKRKAKLAEENNVTLLYSSEGIDVQVIINNIKQLHKLIANNE